MYSQIFKRKSFHIFTGTGKLTKEDLVGIEDFIKTLKPLNSEI